MKTLMLQLHRPGRAKRALLDDALRRYSQCVQFLLDELRDALPPEGGKYALAALVTPEVRRGLDAFDGQPFKDSAILDFAALARGYLEGRRLDPNLPYPRAYLAPDRAERLLREAQNAYTMGKIGARACDRRMDRAIARCDVPRPIYFGRCGAHRDFCLLYHSETGRFMAKLYLLPRGLALPPRPEREEEGGWRYLRPGLPPADDLDGRRRFLLLPLSFGAAQHRDLLAAVVQPDRIRTARLLRRGTQYYLLVSMAGEAPRQPALALGLARAPGGLRYCLGTEAGFLPWNGAPTAANRIRDLALANSAQVVLEGGGRAGELLPWPEYAALGERLAYKLTFSGLPAPATVTARGLECACPRCGLRNRRSLGVPGLFVCVSCGFACPAEEVPARALASRLELYRSNRIPFQVRPAPGGMRYGNEALGFSCVLPYEDLDALCGELRRFLAAAPAFEPDGRRYGALKKLRAAPDLRKAIRIVH